MSITFNDSEGHTIGIEVEVQLIDRDTMALTPTSTKIIDGLKDYTESIKHELMLSNLEINTKICSNIDEAERDLTEKFNIAITEASKYNTLLCCAGTHPFSPWKDQQITEDKRYKRLLRNLQIIARRFNIFGLHVHVGINGAERCIYILKRLLYYLPHLLALSANSPFWEGYDTGLRSYRTKVFESLPIAGLPFFFKDWADYTKLVENYLATRTVETIRDIWWDIRPHPDFGTLEVRICDAPSTIREILALAALIQALIKKLGDEYENGVPFKQPHSSVIRENKWRACRYGLGEEFITPDGNRTIRAREAIEELIASVDEDAKELGSREYISHIKDILNKGEGAVKQLNEWKRQGELKAVTKEMSERLYREVSSGMPGK
ncbi:MAG: carboxylate-amine ligase [Thermodesulfobacteriota bacterium]